jgi:DNA-directed RNA polymerase specialized sigma24 family protein
MQANGKSTEEIAEAFDCQPATMRKRLSRWAKQTARNAQEEFEDAET